ncbi:response regulator PleD [mine drainage metagenome]|uniref:Response regulator PleD n=1 Tax=mine drainage metagenome TaxID=410659 RepID=A0A1J5R9S0_9ZZZZ
MITALSQGPRTDLSACRVLVVEDAPAIRKIIGAYLQAAGILHVDFACDGVEGLTKVESFDPDLVILDIMMPEMDGFEVARSLRADPRHRHLPILVQTALESPAERTEVFRAGANDLITKPIHGPELVARVRVQLENRLLIRDLENYRRHIQTDLELARKMQEDLLPSPKVLEAIHAETGLSIAAHFQPSAELGGDMWHLRDLGQGRYAIILVDFAGHGITAALNTFRLHTLTHQQTLRNLDKPSEYLYQLNDLLVDLLPSNQFATLFLGVVDTVRETLTWSGAGAPMPIYGVGEQMVYLEADGLPMGISRKGQYRDQQVPFPKGAFLLLYSDALTETPDERGMMLNDEQLLAMAAAAHADQFADRPLTSLLDLFRQNRRQPTDDLTLLWLSRG